MAIRSRKKLGNAVLAISLALLVIGMSIEGPVGSGILLLAIVGFVAAVVLVSKADGDPGGGQPGTAPPRPAAAPAPTERASPPEPMDTDSFWRIIEEIGIGEQDDEAHAAALEARLRTMSADDIAAFQLRLDKIHDELYSWDLWAAAYVLQGGCSDDGFDDFRSWVVSQGRGVVDVALTNPDGLADVDLPEDVEAGTSRELFSYAPAKAYEAVAGRELDVRLSSYSSDPAGEPWSEAGDDLARRVPRLWDRFGA